MGDLGRPASADRSRHALPSARLFRVLEHVCVEQIGTHDKNRDDRYESAVTSPPSVSPLAGLLNQRLQLVVTTIRSS